MKTYRMVLTAEIVVDVVAEDIGQAMGKGRELSELLSGDGGCDVAELDVPEVREICGGPPAVYLRVVDFGIPPGFSTDQDPRDDVPDIFGDA